MKDQPFSQILKYFKDFLCAVVKLNSRTFEIYCDVQDANQTPQLKSHIFLSVVYLLRQCFFYQLFIDDRQSGQIMRQAAEKTMVSQIPELRPQPSQKQRAYQHPSLMFNSDVCLITSLHEQQKQVTAKQIGGEEIIT